MTCTSCTRPATGWRRDTTVKSWTGHEEDDPMNGIRRDPFARGGYARETVGNESGHDKCAWCGQSPKRLYRYTWEHDDRTSAPDFRGAKLFCNIGCHDSYHR